MSNRMVFSGVEELKAELRALPAKYADEASEVVLGAAHGAADDVVNAYSQHSVTGDLASHVFVSNRGMGQFGAGAVVRNTAKHAWIFENGTQARHYVTVKGNQHLTGQMPGFHVFIPAMARFRRQMYQKLIQIVEREGVTVTGTP